MGAVVGRENAATLSYEIIRQTPAYEIRHYEATPVIEVNRGKIQYNSAEPTRSENFMKNYSDGGGNALISLSLVFFIELISS